MKHVVALLAVSACTPPAYRVECRCEWPAAKPSLEVQPFWIDPWSNNVPNYWIDGGVNWQGYDIVPSRGRDL